MKIFKVPITVKEVSYHLAKEVDRLLIIHKKVSNPDFEAELVKNTGIGWKQVKNYKNHPKQYQVVSDNAKILEFVEEARSRDKFYKLKACCLYLGLLILIMGAGWIGFKLLYNPAPKTYIVVTNKLPAKALSIAEVKFAPTVFEIPETAQKIQLGKIEDSGINLNEFNCNEMESVGSQNCQKSFTNQARIMVLTSNSFVYKFIYTRNSTPGNIPKELIKFYEGIKARYKKTQETKVPYFSEKFENKDEMIEVITSMLPDGRMFLFIISFELKRK